MKAKDYRNQIESLKNRLNTGENYYVIRKEAEPIIAEMNKIGETIAKKHKKQFYPFFFEKLMR